MLTENTYQSEQRNMSTVRVKMSENAGAGVKPSSLPRSPQSKVSKTPGTYRGKQADFTPSTSF